MTTFHISNVIIHLKLRDLLLLLSAIHLEEQIFDVYHSWFLSI